MEFQHLFQPIRIGSVEIKNRIAVAGGGTTRTSLKDGYVDAQVVANFAVRARGGAGLIITPSVVTNRLAYETHPGNLCSLYEFDQVQGLSQIADAAHAFGAKVFVQLSPGMGPQGSSRRFGVQPVSASPFRCVVQEQFLPRGMKSAGGRGGQDARELTVEEIVDMEDRMAQAAVWSRNAGFDGIELHAAHGYLLFRFLSPRSNRRTDIYGGSLENRLRFATNIVRKVRERVGADMALGARLNIDERMDGGLTHQDCLVIAAELESTGLDFVHLSDGCAEKMVYMLPDDDGAMLEGASNFKTKLRIPVITPSVHDPATAEAAIRDGKTDMISMCRQLMSDPELPNKVREGRTDQIRRCRRDNFCMRFAPLGLAARCVWNPESGREQYDPANWLPPYKAGVPQQVKRQP